jgi:tetratricopeptide (TPR) repeat protein
VRAFDASSPLGILSNSQIGRDVIQNFCPLAESLEWQLGQDYLRRRGARAFTSDASPVPFVVNNDGTLSRNAAEVLFAALAEAEREGPLEGDLYVLELGIGVGLFARFFLDHFRDLCQKHGKDYYDRLCYLACDRSEAMLRDALRHGVFANHPGRVRLRAVDALCPEQSLPHDVMFRGQPVKLRTVFLNYLLDCLPAAVLRLDDDPGPGRGPETSPQLSVSGQGRETSPQPRVTQLCVRTCLARGVRLADHTDLTLAAIRHRANSPDPRAREELLEVYGLFASEYDYRPVDHATVPYGAFALEFGRQRTRRVLHSYGAIQSLEKLLGLLHDDGFILCNEYGQTQTALDDEFEHQRFSLATAVGLNFPLLRAYFADAKQCAWEEPDGDDRRGIHSRLLARRVGIDTRRRFHDLFGAAAQARLQEPADRARACLKGGRFELAATHYQEALRLQTRNWVLLAEVSAFLTFTLRDPRAGADLAKLALALNPACSSELWNTLGDALYECGRTAEAGSAYRQALQVNESDARARYNLSWVHTREGDYAAALSRIAEALALDRTGERREQLLRKQAEVLELVARQHQQEYLLLANLVSQSARPGEKPAEPPPPGGRSERSP